MASAYVRSMEQWVDILKSHAGQNICDTSAKHLLGDLIAYRHGTKHEEDDRSQVANFMLAVAHIAVENAKARQ